MTDPTPTPPAAPVPAPAPETSEAPTPAPIAEPAGPVTYGNEDLVYVDPDARQVLGKVEWSRNGNPKSMPRKREEPVAKDGERKRISTHKHYPFGTYRSMKNAFKLEGKQKKADTNKTLEEIMEKALKEPFWD